MLLEITMVATKTCFIVVDLFKPSKHTISAPVMPEMAQNRSALHDVLAQGASNRDIMVGYLNYFFTKAFICVGCSYNSHEILGISCLRLQESIWILRDLLTLEMQLIWPMFWPVGYKPWSGTNVVTPCGLALELATNSPFWILKLTCTGPCPVDQ